jgi:hypothetical protein
MIKKATLAAIALVVSLGACQKTGEGEYEVRTPDIDVSSDTHTVRTPEIGTTTDTLRTPVFGTEEDTIVVRRPTVGTEPREIQRPTVTRP